jgi:hypothetical protein
MSHPVSGKSAVIPAYRVLKVGTIAGIVRIVAEILERPTSDVSVELFS